MSAAASSQEALPGLLALAPPAEDPHQRWRDHLLVCRSAICGLVDVHLRELRSGRSHGVSPPVACGQGLRLLVWEDLLLLSEQGSTDHVVAVRRVVDEARRLRGEAYDRAATPWAATMASSGRATTTGARRSFSSSAVGGAGGHTER